MPTIGRRARFLYVNFLPRTYLLATLKVRSGTHGLNVGRHRGGEGKLECTLCGAECECVVGVSDLLRVKILRLRTKNRSIQVERNGYVMTIY